MILFRFYELPLEVTILHYVKLSVRCQETVLRYNINCLKGNNVEAYFGLFLGIFICSFNHRFRKLLS